jgi:hypothetical protein
MMPDAIDGVTRCEEDMSSRPNSPMPMARPPVNMRARVAEVSGARVSPGRPGRLIHAWRHIMRVAVVIKN